MKFVRQTLEEHLIMMDSNGKIELLSVSEFITCYDYKYHPIKIYTFNVSGNVEYIELAARYEMCADIGSFKSLTENEIAHCKATYDKAINMLCELLKIKKPYSNYEFYLTQINNRDGGVYTLSITNKKGE